MRRERSNWVKPLRRLAIACAVGLLVQVAPGTAEEKALRGVALVIGQSEYEHLAPLPNPENDADAIDGLLSDLGFEVDLVSNADGKKLTRSLERFVEDAEGADVAFLYYSGHGIEGGGENFLLPVDADQAALDNAGERLVPLSKILADLQAKVPVTIILLDACRTNPFPANATLKVAADSTPVPVGVSGLGTPRGAVSLSAPASPAEGLGAVLGFAAAPGHAALDGDPGANSPYAAALLKHLSAGGYAFSDVMTMVAEEVYLKTGARQVPWTNTSLRRLLYFGEVVEDEAADEAAIRGERRKLLLSLASVPDIERRQVVSVAGERGVPMDALFAMLNAIGANVPDDADQLSRLLNDQAARLKSLLAERQTLKSADPEIARLAALAGEAVREGALETAIAFHERAKARVSELESTLVDAEADLKARRTEHAAVFAASADTYALSYDYAHAAQDFGKAFEQIERWDDALALRYKLAEARSYADLSRLKGDNAATDRAIDAFQAAARLAPADTDPEGWADAQSGLGSAMLLRGDRQADADGIEQAGALLKAAIASPALAAYPDKRAQLNADLSRVLMSLGMREPGPERLVEAEQAVLSALEIRTKDNAPQQWARLQNLLGSILYLQGTRRQSNEIYHRAETAFRAAQEVWSIEETPLDWANAQNNLGIVIGQIGTGEPGTARLLEAVDLLKSIAGVRTREVAPLHWADTQMSLAGTYIELGKRESGSTRWFDDAVVAIHEALQEITRERDPLHWALVQDTLGSALHHLGERNRDLGTLEEAISAFKEAASVRTRERVPLDWAQLQSKIATVNHRIGIFAEDPARVRQARALYETALEEITFERDQSAWANLQNNLANTFTTLGIGEDGVDSLRQAVEHYMLALGAYDRKDNSVSYADAQYNMSLVYLNIGRRTGLKSDFDAARAALKVSVDIYHAANNREWDSYFSDIETMIQISETEADIAAKLKAAQAAPQ